MPIGTNTQAAADLLRKGEVVAIPTETVYGLAANAYNEAAVLKIFQAKQRPAFDPLIVHVHSLDQVKEVVSFSELKRKDTRKEAEALMAKFWPGPLTLVLPKSDRVPDLVTSGLDTVAVRMPAHPMALELLRSLDFPLAAPSANPFGYVSPTTAQHVADQLGEKIPYILDGGPCTVGVESTIIGWESDAEQWVLYRPGGTPVVGDRSRDRHGRPSEKERAARLARHVGKPLRTAQTGLHRRCKILAEGTHRPTHRRDRLHRKARSLAHRIAFPQRQHRRSRTSPLRRAPQPGRQRSRRDPRGGLPARRLGRRHQRPFAQGIRKA
jgi:tRNA threonylcarbamoyl adenosine modification protein (Sua5/YciO/YrdC/YwlC family)